MLDDSAALPEGTTLYVIVAETADDDGVDPAEQAAFEAALEEGLDDGERGRVIEARDALARLRDIG